MMALRWTDVDLGSGRSACERSDWKGHVTTHEGRAPALRAADGAAGGGAAGHRHLRGDRVLCQPDGSPLTQKIVQDAGADGRRGGRGQAGGVHVLRHTFCSHLAMRGAPARAIQELAGHTGSRDDAAVHAPESGGAGRAIRLLESRGSTRRGDILEAAERVNP